MQRITDYVYRRVDAASVAAFRMFFGALMASEAFTKYFGMVDSHFHPDKVHFTYPLLGWVAPWPGLGMYLHIVLMGFAALGVMAGLFYRSSIVVYFLTYTHLFLIEQSIYNNHYYLIILLAFLLIFIDGTAAGAVDTLRHRNRADGTVPYWNVLILRAQFLIVYAYGGIAKINGDWLRGEPIRHWLAQRSDFAVIGPILNEEWAVWFFAYGGLLFDLAIAFALLWKRTRLIALIPFTFFHLMNLWFFDIGVFPILALGAVVVFFEPATPRSWLAWIGAQTPSPDCSAQAEKSRRHSRAVVALLACYLFIQIGLPLRHFAYDGNVSWNEAGHTFAWHMMLRSKRVRGSFTVIDAATGEEFRFATDEMNTHLRNTQRRRMLMRPQMILQYAKFLHEKHIDLGVTDPIVRADIRASLNGRLFQPLIDPDVDLAKAEYRLFQTPDWILPLEPGLEIGLYPDN